MPRVRRERGARPAPRGRRQALREAKDACQRARRREVDPQRKGGGGAATRGASPRTFEVFRGDRARIQRFDEREIRRGEYGRGFYFVDDVGVADGYGPVVDAYLVTLRAPYEMRQFGGWLRELAALVGEAAPSGIDARSRWVTEKLRGLGYDGIVVKMATGVTYVVAFDPDQIARVEERPQPRIPQAEPVRAKVRVRGWEPAF